MLRFIIRQDVRKRLLSLCFPIKLFFTMKTLCSVQEEAHRIIYLYSLNTLSRKTKNVIYPQISNIKDYFICKMILLSSGWKITVLEFNMFELMVTTFIQIFLIKAQNFMLCLNKQSNWRTITIKFSVHSLTVFKQYYIKLERWKTGSLKRNRYPTTCFSR